MAPSWPRLWVLYFAGMASHGVLDALTNGGQGIAFFAPLSAARWHFPWQPILVSPIGVGAFLLGHGFQVLLNEMVWLWLPSLLIATTVAAGAPPLQPRPKPSRRDAASTEEPCDVSWRCVDDDAACRLLARGSSGRAPHLPEGHDRPGRGRLRRHEGARSVPVDGGARLQGGGRLGGGVERGHRALPEGSAAPPALLEPADRAVELSARGPALRGRHRRPVLRAELRAPAPGAGVPARPRRRRPRGWCSTRMPSRRTDRCRWGSGRRRPTGRCSPTGSPKAAPTGAPSRSAT